MTKCPYCSVVLPEGAKICRGCGRMLGAGGMEYSVADEAPSGESSGGEVRTARPGDPPPRCEICDKSPIMVQQVERNSPIVPAVLSFLAFLALIVVFMWHSWAMKLFLLFLAAAMVFVAYRIFTGERRYWLCPKCGDTIEIE